MHIISSLQLESPMHFWRFRFSAPAFSDASQPSSGSSVLNWALAGLLSLPFCSDKAPAQPGDGTEGWVHYYARILQIDPSIPLNTYRYEVFKERYNIYIYIIIKYTYIYTKYTYLYIKYTPQCTAICNYVPIDRERERGEKTKTKGL